MTTVVEFSPKVRLIILDRAGGRCEGCRRRTSALELHHRQYKSRGGLGTVENGLALCGMGNVQGAGCHGVAHTGVGEDNGWSIRSKFDPRTWPCKRWLPIEHGMFRAAWVELTQLGTFTELSEVEALDRMGRS